MLDSAGWCKASCKGRAQGVALWCVRGMSPYHRWSCGNWDPKLQELERQEEEETSQLKGANKKAGYPKAGADSFKFLPTWDEAAPWVRSHKQRLPEDRHPGHQGIRWTVGTLKKEHLLESFTRRWWVPWQKQIPKSRRRKLRPEEIGYETQTTQWLLLVTSYTDSSCFVWFCDMLQPSVGQVVSQPKLEANTNRQEEWFFLPWDFCNWSPTVQTVFMHVDEWNCQSFAESAFRKDIVDVRISFFQWEDPQFATANF